MTGARDDGVAYRQPSWSPDGTRLAFVQGHPRRFPYVSQVGVMDVQGDAAVSEPACSRRTSIGVVCLSSSALASRSGMATICGSRLSMAQACPFFGCPLRRRTASSLNWSWG